MYPAFVYVVGLALLAYEWESLPGGSVEGSSVAVARVIDHYVRACGGPALATVATEKRTGTLLRGQFGKVPLETMATRSGAWVYRQTFAFGDQVIYGCDGSEAWIQDTKGVQSMDEDQRRDLQILLDPHYPLKVRELYSHMEILGVEEPRDADTVMVEATTLAGTVTHLAFDRITGLLVRAGGMIFEDYREIDGVTRPFRVLLGQRDENEHPQMILEIADTRHNVEADLAMFQKPAGALPLTHAPLYRERHERDVGEAAMSACVGVYQHPDKPEVTYSVTVRDGHLMLHRTGWPTERELKPQSETDYFFRFPGTDFHFVTEDSGEIVALQIDGGVIEAPRIE